MKPSATYLVLHHIAAESKSRLVKDSKERYDRRSELENNPQQVIKLDIMDGGVGANNSSDFVRKLYKYLANRSLM